MPACLHFGLKVTQVTSAHSLLVRTITWPNLTEIVEEQMEYLMSTLSSPQACISLEATYQSDFALLQVDVDQKVPRVNYLHFTKCFHNRVYTLTTQF